MEISFCGADFGKYEYFHFNLDIYEQIAYNFIATLFDFFEQDGTKIKSVIYEIEQIIAKNAVVEKKERETDDSDYSNEENKENLNNIEENEKNNLFFIIINILIKFFP